MFTDLPLSLLWSLGDGWAIKVGMDLSQQDTFSIFSSQWDPEDVNLERKKDPELLRSQARRASLSPVDLTSDD